MTMIDEEALARIQRAWKQAMDLLGTTPLSDRQQRAVANTAARDEWPEEVVEELRGGLSGRIDDLHALRYRAKLAREAADALDALVDDLEVNSPLAQRRRRRAA